MDVISPNDFRIDNLYIESAKSSFKLKKKDSRINSIKQQEILFDTFCEGLMETWNVDERSCLEALININKFAVKYNIPNTKHSEEIASIITKLLSIDNEMIIKNSLLVVSNAFSQKNFNDIGKILLNDKDIINVVHELFTKFGKPIYTQIFLTISNMAGTSEYCRNRILSKFSPEELKDLLTSKIVHSRYKDYYFDLNLIQRYEEKCKAFLTKLCFYELSNENATTLFRLLVELKSFTGNWIFEQMGRCAKWINDIQNIDQKHFEEANNLLLSDNTEDIKSSLIFISYTTKEINETIINLLNNDNDDISCLAIWSVCNFINSHVDNAYQVCKDCNIFEAFHQEFLNGSYKKKVEICFCLSDIIKVSTTSERAEIVSKGFCSDLAEILLIDDNDDLSKRIIQSFSLLLSNQENEETVLEVIRVINENEIYEKASEEINSRNSGLSDSAKRLISILDKIE